jgi:membrane protein YdbS with pleckstrin-like domain
VVLYLPCYFYERLYRACYRYGIEANHLILSKGIILKQRGQFPLSRITDVYLDRTLGDLFFGLYNLHLSTPTSHSEKFARIDGLKLKTALAFQKYLTTCLESTHPQNKPVQPLADQQANA